MGSGSPDSPADGQESGGEAEHHCLLRGLSPELLEVVRALPALPDAVKAGIVAMVKAAASPDDFKKETD